MISRIGVAFWSDRTNVEISLNGRIEISEEDEMDVVLNSEARAKISSPVRVVR